MKESWEYRCRVQMDEALHMETVPVEGSVFRALICPVKGGALSAEVQGGQSQRLLIWRWGFYLNPPVLWNAHLEVFAKWLY